MPRIEYFMDIQTKSEANLREHWAIRARRAGRQRNMAMLVTRSSLVRAPTYPIRGTPLQIMLIRVNGRRLDPDNLAGSFKHVQDGICDALGIDDGDPAHSWEYRQEPSRVHGRGVLVRIEW